MVLTGLLEEMAATEANTDDEVMPTRRIRLHLESTDLDSLVSDEVLLEPSRRLEYIQKKLDQMLLAKIDSSRHSLPSFFCSLLASGRCPQDSFCGQVSRQAIKDFY